MTNTEVSEFTKPSAEDTQTITNWLDSEDGECVKFVVLLFWFLVLVFGFVAFGYWMKRQMDYNKQAEADPNQIK